MTGTSKEIIKSVKLRGSIPDSQDFFDEDDFLLLLSEEMQTRLVPRIIQAREDFFLEFFDFKIVRDQSQQGLGFGLEPFGLTPFGGSGTTVSTSRLMSRSLSGRIKDIHELASNGKVVRRIPRVDFDSIVSWQDFNGFYFKNDNIIFHPENYFANRTVRIYFYRKPNTLVSETKCTKIQFLNATDRKITVQNIPDSSTWKIGSKLDIIQSSVPYTPVLDSVTILDIQGAVLTLDNWVPNITTGDYVSLAGEACVAQIPAVAYPLLSELGNIKFKQSFGNQSELQDTKMAYAELENLFVNFIQPRAEKPSRKLTSFRGIWSQ